MASTPLDLAPRRSAWEFLKQEFKPKGPIVTPFNALAAFISGGGLVLTVIRFWKGL